MKVVFRLDSATLSSSVTVTLWHLAYSNDYSTDLQLYQHEPSMLTNFGESLWIDREAQVAAALGAGFSSTVVDIGPFVTNNVVVNPASKLVQTLTFTKVPIVLYKEFESKILTQNKIGVPIFIDNYYESYTYLSPAMEHWLVDHRTYKGTILDYRVKRYGREIRRAYLPWTPVENSVVDLSITFSGFEESMEAAIIP